MVEYNLGKVRGEDGKGIESINKIDTTDNIDTYEIQYTNGDTQTYTITNGRDGTAGNIDDNVTQNSQNPVKSSGIYTALTGKANTVHTHTKNQITDFTHSHSISDVTDLQTNLNAKVNASDIANNLTTTASGKVLDARQGKALKDYIDGLVGDIEEDMLQ